MSDRARSFAFTEPPGTRLWDLLDDGQRRAVRAASAVRRFAAGAVVDRPERVLILMAGRVKIVSWSAAGHSAVLALRDPGDLVGWILTGAAGSLATSAIAVEPVTAMALSNRALAGVLRDHPAISDALLHVAAARLGEAEQRRVELGDSTATSRIAALLVDLVERYGVAGRDGTLIGLRISQHDLAGLASTSRRSVVRTFRSLRDGGVLTTGRQQVVVRDLPGLRRLAGCQTQRCQPVQPDDDQYRHQ